MPKYRIYLKDSDGTCLRTRILHDIEEVKEELPLFTKRTLEYIVVNKIEEYKINIREENNE